ncbi:hypothetical protein Zm00014a_005170 [Zea mays]|uniref:Uncharacterized protein n=1 Tax=Zea mays TaxID=4577 RepID=A0A3L6G5I7_MAIZE|nr:hypothetical protein Zm00014a_005170 [Zea mays]
MGHGRLRCRSGRPRLTRSRCPSGKARYAAPSLHLGLRTGRIYGGPNLLGRFQWSTREVIGAVLKHLGSSYNTVDMEIEVNGGRAAVLNSFTQLQKQVQLFHGMNYLKSFSLGDVMIPAAKRMSNVAVVVPKSGSSLWADLWARYGFPHPQCIVVSNCGNTAHPRIPDRSDR